MTSWSCLAVKAIAAVTLFGTVTADSDDFIYGNYHIPFHEATVTNSDIDCLSICGNKNGKCDACKGESEVGYCCNALVEDGDVCPEGVVNAIKDHTSKNDDHYGKHHGQGLIKINFCVEVEDFDYVGDGYLTTGIKYAIPYHPHDSETVAINCLQPGQDGRCDAAGRCDNCNYEGQPGYCCPHVADKAEFSCIDDHNDDELFDAIESHFKNQNHLFDHHQEKGFHMCVAMDCSNVEIIGIDCADDFKIHVTVNLGCFKQEYPTVDITDLVFSPPGQSDDTTENTCGAFTDGADGKNYWYSDEDLTQAATVDSCHMWFSIANCGLMPVVSNDNVLIYNIALSSYRDPKANLLLKAGMNEQLITCKYNPDIDVETLGDTYKIMLDSIEDKNDVIAPGTGSPEVTNNVQIKKDETYTDLDKNEKVILGSDMKVTFNGPEMAGFYIKSCVASDNDETKTLALVTNGCVETSGSSITDIKPSLEPATCDAGRCTTSLLFSQFGFVVDSTDKANPDLEFTLTCSLAFGPAPNCNGRRRIDDTASVSEATVSYKCKVGEDTKYVDNVATKRTEAESSATILASFLCLYFILI